MLSKEFDSIQNTLSIYLNYKNFPFLNEKYACGFPATRRALTSRAKARPIIDNLAPHQQAQAHAWLPGTLKQLVPQESEDISMFNSRSKYGHEKDSRKNLPQIPFISWTEQMCVDVKLLDNDHKKLAILITELHDGIVAGLGKQALECAFEGVVRHTRIHFAHEEQLFAETVYPSAAMHKLEHDNLIDRIKKLQARFKSDSDFASYIEVVNLLKGWLFGHIQSLDQEYTAHLKAMGVDSMLAAQERHMGVARKRPAARPKTVQGSWSA
jgi:hemerythrin